MTLLELRDAMGTRTFDVAIVGAGLVGSAIGYGLAGRGLRVAVFDEGDRALRAARANFGLVWVSGKAANFLPYARWTRRSIALWREFSRSIEEETGSTLAYRNQGGLIFCLGDEELLARQRLMAANPEAAELWGAELIERAELERLMPAAGFGAAVTGASFGSHDGDCNPLFLLRGLHAAMSRRGAALLSNAAVKSVNYQNGRFAISTGKGTYEAGKVVLAAGHGSVPLAPALGLPCPIHAERGQILVTERLAPFLPLPASGLRQSGEGTVLIGASKEDVGLDDGTTVAVGAKLAARAVRIVPKLAQARLVRTWGGVRVLTPDGAPVYAESSTCPGAFIALCHSGVTLAAAHANDFAECIAKGRLTESLQAFNTSRFNA